MIILCADDFGISPGVNQGIGELGAADRLSATSAMVTFEDWSQSAVLLRELRIQMAVGLHLNLTLGQPLVAAAGGRHLDGDGRLLPVKLLIKGVVLGRLDQEALRRECHAQIKTFRDAVGALPDFIDGHQHVHALPVIGDALVDAIGDFSWARPPLIRSPSDGVWRSRHARKEWAKREMVSALTSGMRRKLVRAGLPTNDTFAGFSSFTVGSDYGDELRSALAGGGDCHLVMCHPGYGDDELRARGDPVVERRREELSGIMAFEGLAARIWHVKREAGGAIDWAKAMTA